MSPITARSTAANNFGQSNHIPKDEMIRHSLSTSGTIILEAHNQVALRRQKFQTQYRRDVTQIAITLMFNTHLTCTANAERLKIQKRARRLLSPREGSVTTWNTFPEMA